MNTEYLDIVNERDEVIGRDTRENVHRRHDIHRGIHVFVVGPQDDILVQRRATTRDYYPGYLDISVGGQVASGESYERAAIRELHEEIGCDVSHLVEIGAYDAFSERQREKRHVFVHLWDGTPLSLSSEVESARFMSLDEILTALESDKFTAGFRRSLDLYVSVFSDPPDELSRLLGRRVSVHSEALDRWRNDSDDSRG